MGTTIEKARLSRRKHYNKNKDYYIGKTIERKHRLQQFIKKQKIGKKCEFCSEPRPACLQFHHIKDKKYNICQMANQGCSEQTILKEIDKCKLICANCHFCEHQGYRFS